MHRTPTGQRPQLTQSNSAGWSWPRLLPIHERQARGSIEKDSSIHSPKTHPVLETTEQNPSLTDMASNRSTGKMATPRSPTISATDSTTQSEKSVPARLNNGRRFSKTEGIVSPISELEVQPSGKGVDTPKSEGEVSTTDESNAVEQSDTGSNIGRARRTSGNKRQSSVDQDQHVLQSISDKSIDDVSSTAELQDASSSIRSRTVSFGTMERRRDLREKSIDHDMSAAQEPHRDLGKRRRTTPMNAEAPILQGVADEASADKTPTASRHQELTNAPAPKDEPASYTPTPIPQVTDRVSAPAEPIPYYATPKICVHRPSASSLSETSGPRTIDEVLAKERGLSSLQERQPAIEPPSSPPLSSIISQLPESPTGPGVHRVVKMGKVRKRSLFLRKARNAAARETILKITLGRRLASPTKQALRHLAHGEAIIEEDPMSTQAIP